MIQDWEEPKRRLTVEQLRKYKGCENLSNEEAEKVIASLAELAYLALRDLKIKSDDQNNVTFYNKSS